MLKTITFKVYVFFAIVFLFTFTMNTGFADEELCPPADLNGDCFIDFFDLAILTEQWLWAPITCSGGFVDCDANYVNGCEVDINDGGGSCAAAAYIGQVCGDERTGTLCMTNNCTSGPYASDRGEKWYRIYVQECASCSSNLHVWMRLQPPANVDYDLYIYAPCGSLLDQSTNSGSQQETVDYYWNDTGGSDDSRYIYIEIRYYNGSSCSNWSLQTWGGCETGP